MNKSDKKAINNEFYWNNNFGIFHKIPTSHAPNNFIGDCTDSLRENPKYKK